MPFSWKNERKARERKREKEVRKNKLRKAGEGQRWSFGEMQGRVVEP